MGAARGVVSLFEGSEQPGHHLGADAHPGVLDLEADQRVVVCFFGDRAAWADVSTLGEAHRIGEVVEQGLAHWSPLSSVATSTFEL